MESKMSLNIKLYNGRNDPEEELDDWGFEGPLLENVKAVQWTYGAEIKIHFHTEEDQRKARELTGWNTLGPEGLCAYVGGEYIETEVNDVVSYYGDFNIFEN